MAPSPCLHFVLFLPSNPFSLDIVVKSPFQKFSSGEGNGNPLQCSCLENPRDSRAWWAAVCGVAQSWTRLKQLSSSSSSSKWLYNIQLKTSRGVLFLLPSDAYVRSFLYLFYALIKLYSAHTHKNRNGILIMTVSL